MNRVVGQHKIVGQSIRSARRLILQRNLVDGLMGLGLPSQDLQQIREKECSKESLFIRS